jgi:peroxiredoxin
MTWLSRMFGGKTMQTLSTGSKAPDFTLPMMDNSTFSLQHALSRGPVLLAFFKISCPVCQYAFPFFERIYRAHGGGTVANVGEPEDKTPGGKVTIVGVSQNEANDTKQFLQRFGITFPILLDDTKTFPASNAYGLTNVPSAFWIAQDGDIEIASVGWSKADVTEMARKAAEANNAKALPIFQPSEQVADFRAG